MNFSLRRYTDARSGSDRAGATGSAVRSQVIIISRARAQWRLSVTDRFYDRPTGAVFWPLSSSCYCQSRAIPPCALVRVAEDGGRKREGRGVMRKEERQEEEIDEERKRKQGGVSSFCCFVFCFLALPREFEALCRG